MLSFANGKHVRSDRAVEGRTGTGTQRSAAHRRSFGRARQRLKAHGHGSEPEKDGGSAESKVGEGEARIVTIAPDTKLRTPDRRNKYDRADV